MTATTDVLPASTAFTVALAAITGEPPIVAATAIAIRPALDGDLAAITRIYNESLPPLPTPLPGVDARAGGRPVLGSCLAQLPADGLANWMASHRANGRPLWVAQAGVEVVGWLSLLGFADRPACMPAAEVAIYIASGWRGCGVGRRLLSHARIEAPLWHIDRLMAFIWHDNAASLTLFRAQGFSAWGRLPGIVWADAKSRDMVILGQVLQAG